MRWCAPACKVVAEFSDLPAEPGISDISSATRLVMDAFLQAEVDDVFIAYTISSTC